MGGLLGTSTKQPQAQTTTVASGITIQSSCYGSVIPVVYGANKIAPNLIWYGAFTAIPHTTTSSSGGSSKGGGGAGSTSSTSYTYTASFAWCLCEGQIAGVGKMWVGQNSTAQSPASLGYGNFIGTYPQEPWGYLQGFQANQAANYPGFAYLVAANYDLGTSTSMPNNNVEVLGFYCGPEPEDIDPSWATVHMLTDPHCGLTPVFPTAWIGDLSSYSNYCRATGLLISPAYTTQQTAAQSISDNVTYTNADIAWTGGVLNIIPRGDQVISANGVTYTPPAFTFDLTDDDWLETNAATTSSGSSGTDPLVLTQKRPQSIVNKVTVEFSNRNNAYAAEPVSAHDLAAIQTYGLNAGGSQTAHMLTTALAARLSAQLLLQRGSVTNTWQGTAGQHTILIDVGDLGYISNTLQKLDHLPVRVKEITGQTDGSRLFLFEEYSLGVGSAAAHGYATSDGYTVDFNADPGDINPPTMFEPPDALAGDLELWIAVSGGPLWAGCWIWASLDGEKYERVGLIDAPARMGALTAAIPAWSTTDNTNTLAVNLTESRAELSSASSTAASALATLCYVDGELLAYQTATLTSQYHYGLTRLTRGAYDSSITAHAAGSTFVRIDDNAVLKYPFGASDIGRTVYLKFLSYNIYGGGSQDLSEVEPYACTLRGSALASPLPSVTGLTTAYVSGVSYLIWDPVSDFRPVDYEIRQGNTWSTAQVIGRTSETRAPSYGDGTYWVSAHYRLAAGIDVYSSDWADVKITGAQLVTNVVAGWDEAATGWTGTFANTAAVNGAVELTGAGDLLQTADVLGASDIVEYGGVSPSGTYRADRRHALLHLRTHGFRHDDAGGQHHGSFDRRDDRR